MRMNTEFIKNGKEITTKQNGEDYTLEAGRVYNLKYKPFQGPILEMDGMLSLPDKIYTTADEDVFVNRIIKYFNNEEITDQEVQSIVDMHFDTSMSAFYIIPVLIFCLENTIEKLLK